MKVLIVDDDENNREILRRIVERLGHETRVAVKGSDAIALAKAAIEEGLPFQHVLLDMRMPDMNGAAAAKAFRALAGFASRITAITGDDREDVNMENFDSYIQKPYSMDDIRQNLA